MPDPRGFARCDECEGSGGIDHGGGIDPWNGPRDVEFCRPCGGSGLVPTEKLRREVAVADAVLRKVAEHIREKRET